MPLPPETEADVSWALGTIYSRRTEHLLFADYMAGRHRLRLATTQYALAFRELLFGLRLNICPSVVHAVTDRLKLTGFAGDEANTGLAARAWQLWQDGRLDRHANQVHNEALVSGDAYLLIWPDAEGRPCFYPQMAMDMAVQYDQEYRDRLQLAAKLWLDGKRYRLNLYYPDRIEKYLSPDNAMILATIGGATGIAAATNPSQALYYPGSVPTAGNAFEPYQPESEPWPLPNPYGEVPVFHFAYDAGIGQMGVSELRDIIPLQDAINKELADLIVASEFGAYRQRYAIGLEPDIDSDTGLPLPTPLKVGVDRLLTVANTNAKFGEFSETPLANFTATIDALVFHVARIKGIPLHHLLLLGQLPSGESLKTAEARLVSKVEDIQVDFGDVWEDAMAFALRVDGAEADAKLTAKWAPAQSRAELDHVNAISIKQSVIGISQHQAWRELDYSDEQIAQMDAEKAGEATAAAAALGPALGAG